MKPRQKWPRRLFGNPLLSERVHDPYRSRYKPRETVSCPQCGVRYRNGRWTTPSASVGAVRRSLCPACRRINDRYPAGELLLSGSFLESHEPEIMSRVRHIEAAERLEHPLNRIMDTAKSDGCVTITTTDVHLPHRIAHARQDAWGGTMHTHFDRAGYFTRVRWERNE